MKAVVMTGFGAPKDVLEYRTDYPKPPRNPGEVLVAVHATSINPADWRIREGALPAGMVKVPKVLGLDVAGVVVEADTSSKFKAGDRVVGDAGPGMWSPWGGFEGKLRGAQECARGVAAVAGTYAEFASVKESHLIPIPDGVSFEQAGALPVAGLTAWQTLASSMPLKGKRVLVHAGAGGVGHLTVQVAKALGAYVATTCSSRNADFVTKELGADMAIDYVKDDLVATAGRGSYDVVVDLVGAEPDSWPLLARGGRMIAVSVDKTMAGRGKGFWLMMSILGRMMWLKIASALRLCPAYESILTDPNPEKGLRQVAQLVSEGKVTVYLDRVVPLQQVAEAHEYAAQKRTRGKVVISVVGA